MTTWPLIPGVPAGGHVTGGGFWHPGSADGCVKCQPASPRPRRRLGGEARRTNRDRDGACPEHGDNCPYLR